MKYRLRIRYVYTFYNFDQIMLEDVFDDGIELSDKPLRFTLRHQEDATFTVSEVREDHIGRFVVVTYPNKDNLVVHEGEDCELEYDEYFDAMGDNNHNVYEGTFNLETF